MAHFRSLTCYASAMRLIAAWLLPAICGMCQLPPDTQLSPSDQKLFQQEIHRLEHLLETAGDKDTVMLQLAGTWAGGGQYRRAMEILGKVVDLKVGLDPSSDLDFAKLRGTREFKELLRRVRDDTPAVLNGRVAFTIAQPDLIPEGLPGTRFTKSSISEAHTKPRSSRAPSLETARRWCGKVSLD